MDRAASIATGRASSATTSPPVSAEAGGSHHGTGSGRVPVVSSERIARPSGTAPMPPSSAAAADTRPASRPIADRS